jgi:purine-nucleoside phosphorylase
MKYLGINKLIVSNASGGVNPEYRVGDIVMIKDTHQFCPEHPLRGTNDERFGPRFVNIGEPYSRKMIAKAKELSVDLNIEVKDGYLPWVTRSYFETLAEYNMVKFLVQTA